MITQPAILEAAASPLIPTFVGRDPIFDVNLDVRAYRLQFSEDPSVERASDGEAAAARAFWNAFVELGIENVAGDRRVHVPASRAFLKAECIRLYPTGHLALDIRPDVAADDAVRPILEELAATPLTLVLDGFDGALPADPDIFDTVRIPLSGEEASGFARALGEAGDAGLATIAADIATFADFEACREAGFDAFQGRFLCKPQTVVGGRLPSDSVTRMRLLAAINDPKSSVDGLEEVISQDVGLAYKLLHFVNSAMFALRSEVQSIRHAIMMLGEGWIRTWANMVVLTGIADKPVAAFHTALVRGKMCELLGRAFDDEDAATWFSTGLLSALDFLLDRPMGEILDELPLAPDIDAALRAHQGKLGEALDCTLSYECADWSQVTFGDLPDTVIRASYVNALKWATGVRGALT